MRHSWLIQQAVFAELDGYLGAGTVLDEAPEVDDDGDKIEPPYTVVGETTEVPDDTHSDDGTSETLMLHVWSRATSTQEVKGIMADIDERLHHKVLSLSGGGTVCLTREFAEVLKEESEPGETWRHGVMRYRARTLEAA